MTNTTFFIENSHKFDKIKNTVKQFLKNKKINVLVYMFFSDQTVMPFVHELEQYFDVTILVFKESDELFGSNRKLEKADNIFLCDFSKQETIQRFESADILILGVRNIPSKLYRKCLKTKLVYIFSERPYKKMNHKNALRFFLGSIIHHKIYQKYHPWLLSVGYYTYYDYVKFGNYKKNSLRFCYYPSDVSYDFSNIEAKQQDKKITMVVVGGMYGNKNLVLAIEASLLLKKLGISHSLKFVGDGKYRKNLEEKVKSEALADEVTFAGTLPFEETNQELQNSMIYIIPTGKLEGFNVTSLMAMNSGCVCVSNKESGATLQLFKHMENGLVFDSEEEFLSMIELAATNPQLRIKIAQKAKKDYDQLWSVKIAAKRFKQISEELLNEKRIVKSVFESGSLSLIKNK